MKQEDIQNMWLFIIEVVLVVSAMMVFFKPEETQTLNVLGVLGVVVGLYLNYSSDGKNSTSDELSGIRLGRIVAPFVFVVFWVLVILIHGLSFTSQSGVRSSGEGDIFGYVIAGLSTMAALISTSIAYTAHRLTIRAEFWALKDRTLSLLSNLVTSCTRTIDVIDLIVKKNEWRDEFYLERLYSVRTELLDKRAELLRIENDVHQVEDVMAMQDCYARVASKRTDIDENAQIYNSMLKNW